MASGWHLPSTAAAQRLHDRGLQSLKSLWNLRALEALQVPDHALPQRLSGWGDVVGIPMIPIRESHLRDCYH